MKLEVLDRLNGIEKYFKGSKYKHIVEKASIYWEVGNLERTKEMLDQLPNKEKLLRALIEKLKGKSVYKTLQKIEKGVIESGPQFLKGLFSLGTHISIEVERGNVEYSMLYPIIYEKIGQVLYK